MCPVMATKTVKFNRNVLGFHVGDVAEIEMTDEPKALLEVGAIEVTKDEPTVVEPEPDGTTVDEGDDDNGQPAAATGRTRKSAS